MKENKFKKSIILSIIFILISCSITPIISSNIEKSINTKNSFSKAFSTNKNLEKLDLATFKIFYVREDRSYEKVVKKLVINEAQELIEKINQTLNNEGTINEIFEQSFNILNQYNLTLNNITLNDILDPNLLNGPFDVVEGENFKAHFSPIIILGGGIGLGLGETYRPINVFLHFLAIMGGLAWVYCIDPIEGILYKLQSFLMPILIGYMSAFTGLIMFAVYPGIFYSNIVALGFTPFTTWIQFPSS